MQANVGIVRREKEMTQAIEKIAELRERAKKVRVDGNREYNPGWHTAIDLHHLLVVSEAVARAGIERKESRGAHYHDEYPKKDEKFGQVSIVVKKGSDGSMKVVQEPLRPLRDDLKKIIEEMK
jgi:succinate dehydrogenase / fumarate reductase flavoprotein subunit